MCIEARILASEDTRLPLSQVRLNMWVASSDYPSRDCPQVTGGGGGVVCSQYHYRILHSRDQACLGHVDID